MALPYEERKQKILTIKPGKSNPKYGCNPEERPTELLLTYGVINIDKQKGPTSHQVSAYAQKILEIKKAGHAGTLDPKVTGVLPIALGRGTRVVQALINQGKEYVCIMHLHKPIDEKIIKDSVQQITGEITQLPPIKSAVKRVERQRTVYYLNILEIKGQDVLFTIGCQAGTYIRKICHDWGKLLKAGGHMAELRRTKAAGFDETDSHSLLDLQDAYWFYKNEHNDKFIRSIIQPLERAVKFTKKVWILDSAIESVCHGSNVNVPGIAKLHSDISKHDIIAIMSLKDELVALGQAVMTSHELKQKDRGIVIKTEKVFMPGGTYPRIV